MDELSIKHRLKRLWIKFRSQGFSKGLGSVRSFFRAKPSFDFPLASADPDLILAANVSAIRDFVRRKKGQTNNKEQIDLSAKFPLEYRHTDGKTMRYALFPSVEESHGLVVIFHGYLGFEIHPIQYGWKNFDLLLPYDNFGWKDLGSWFWGQQGDNYVEQMTWALIEKIRGELSSKRWFSIGASMGGFAALFYAIKYSADGVYTMTPIIDLKRKILDYRRRGIKTSYTELAALEDEKLENIPNIYKLAGAAETLPPLFLIQNQYDRSNPFGEDTLPLLERYNEKKGWAGLRVHPSIGHQGHDGGYAEAQYFFKLISSKSPPRRVDFYSQDEAF